MKTNKTNTPFAVEIAEAENKLSPKKVTIREPLVEDILEIEKYDNQTAKSAAMVALLCTFDGKTVTPEEVRRLPLSDFLYLQNELMSRGLMGSEELLSSLSAKAGLSLPQ